MRRAANRHLSGLVKAMCHRIAMQRPAAHGGSYKCVYIYIYITYCTWVGGEMSKNPKQFMRGRLFHNRYEYF